MTLTAEQIDDTAFLEPIAGLIVADRLSNKTPGEGEIVMLMKDVNPNYFNIMSNAPMLFKALGVVHNHVSMLHRIFEIARASGDPSTRTPMFKEIFNLFEALERETLNVRTLAVMNPKQGHAMLRKEQSEHSK